MSTHAVTHAFLRFRLLLALGLVLGASLFGWHVDRAKHQLMSDKSAQSAIFNGALHAMTAAVVALQSVEESTSAGIASFHKRKLSEPAAALDAAMARIELAISEGRLTANTRQILESDVLDPLGLMEDFAYVVHAVASQPELWGERAGRHLVTANSIVSQVLPIVRRISAIEQADLEAGLASYARWRMIALLLVAGLLATIWTLIFVPMKRGIMGAQAELAGQIARAQAASRAKSDFLATMSHEIRTPMNGVLGMAEQLILTRIDAEQREMVRELQTCGLALLTIIEDVLDFERIEAGKLRVDPQPTDIRTILDSVERLFLPQARERGLAFEVGEDGGLAARHLTDGGRLRQILINLVSNALKFTPAGSVTLRVLSEREVDARQRLRLVVEDTGVGMAAADLVRIFEPFEQADASTTRRFGGTGLGLAISQRLARTLGGKIAVRSDLGRGSRFTLVLDLPVAAAADDPAAAKDWASLADLAGTRVLVAEDNRVNAMILTRILQSAGCIATVAGSGDDAVRQASDAPHDIAFMDISMPGMDGYEATRAIRLREEAAGRVPLPIVALTAHLGEQHRQRCLEVGMQAVLRKPFRREEILGAVAKLAVAPRAPRSTGDTAA